MESNRLYPKDYWGYLGRADPVEADFGPLDHCGFCGTTKPPVRIHGHIQCAECTAVIRNCCE